MNVAIYARKSTEQVGVDDDQKSVARQIDHARAFATARGWTVADAHVYADDAVSGAATRKLVNRQRLLDQIAAGRIQVLIMRDASRFSRRDGDEAFGELKRLAQAGVAIWFYQDGSLFKHGTFGDNVVGFVRAEMNAEYRRQIAQWTFDAMARKAKAGHVTGSRLFGYDNVRVDGHMVRRINAAEAAVVRRVFDMSAQGYGYTRIAKLLNAEGLPTPARRRKQALTPAGWNPSTICEVLRRPLYRGQVVWNKTTKHDAAGNPAVIKHPESEWLVLDRPELRIVSEAQWAKVQQRLDRVRVHVAGDSGTRRSRDIDSRYLLSGFVRCAECGGAVSVMNRNHAKSYGCLGYHKRGKTVCANALTMSIKRVDEAVMGALVNGALRPAMVQALLAEVFKVLQSRTALAKAGTLTKQLRALDKKIAHLTDAVEGGAAVAPLVRQLQARQAEREGLIAAIAAAEGVAHMKLDRRAIEQKVLRKVEQWRTRLVKEGRDVLREALDGPLRFTATKDGYRFDGELRTGALIDGLVGVPPYPVPGGRSVKGWNLPISGIAA